MFEAMMKEGITIFLNNVRQGVADFLDSTLRLAQKRVMNVALDLSLMIAGTVALVIGVIMLVSRYVPTDIALIVIGALLFIYSLRNL
ncbi:MAG: hypothetical protein QW331_03635 [Candidatus Woesearchaeota archaeon]